MKKINILIPYTKRHEKFFFDLRFALACQITKYQGEIAILTDDHETDCIGVKRNRLLDMAEAEYVCFFDADDYPSHHYIEMMMQAAASGKDCASLKGSYSVNGKFDGVFEHSIRYKEWRTNHRAKPDEVKYERSPNHISLIRTDIARQFRFPEIEYGEDHNWSRQLHEAGVLQTEHYIEDVIYFYRKISK